MIVADLRKLKTYILSEYNQVEIFAHYLNVPESDIEFCLEHTSNKINNPLRDDKDPSLGFKTVFDNETGLPKIKMYDFANRRYRGDCFDLVGITLYLYNTSGNNFITICKDIIHEMQNKKLIQKSYQTKTITVREKAFIDIEYEARRWNTQDIEYWKSQGLHFSEINKVVHPVEKAYLDGTLIYSYNVSDPCYHYISGYYNFKTLHKLYYPKRDKKDKRGRFTTNNSYFAIECLHELRQADVLIITKSYKDKLLLKKIIANLHLDLTIEVTNFTSETFVIKKDLISALFKTYKHIVTNTDFDYAGISIVNLIKKDYPIQHYFLTNGTFNTIDFGAKDISDYARNFGYPAAENLVLTAYRNFKEEIDNLNEQEDELF